jgi:hypothetical protein
LPSGERARQVTGAQCAMAVSRVFALSADISLILLSACPPKYSHRRMNILVFQENEKQISYESEEKFSKTQL